MKFNPTCACALKLAFLLIVVSAPAQGAITLMIDTSAKTFSWTGSATTSFTLQEREFAYVRLGSGSWNGGSVSGTGANSLGVNVDAQPSFSVIFSPSIFLGQLILAGGEDTVVSDIGVFDNFGFFDEPASVTLTVNGDGQAYSYFDYTPDSINFLESLDGTQLYFQNQSGMGGINFGDVAGQIVVIPEPSSIAFGVAGAFLLLRRRRCTLR